MADRDFAAFGRYVAEDCVFFSGSTALRGRDAVLAAWKPFFDGAQRRSRGSPIRSRCSTRASSRCRRGSSKTRGAVTARFNSIWRRQADGRWLVVFDKGGPP